MVTGWRHGPSEQQQQQDYTPVNLGERRLLENSLQLKIRLSFVPHHPLSLQQKVTYEPVECVPASLLALVCNVKGFIVYRLFLPASVRVCSAPLKSPSSMGGAWNSSTGTANPLHAQIHSFATQSRHD
jgi:hypothetical protein